MLIHFWNYAASIAVITYKSVSKRSRTFITVIMQIRTFSLNLGTSNKNFETTKYSLKRSFQKKYEYQKKNIFFRNCPEKQCVLTLSSCKSCLLNFLYYCTFNFWCSTFFFINEIFLKSLKPLWKYDFSNTIFLFLQVVYVKWEKIITEHLVT